ncbi:DinB family protein, partial [Piscirickettsia salmonis]
MEITSRFNDVILWLNRYHKVRATTEQICESLEIEDYVVQSHPDVSPVKWHLGHTTWFFESFILVKYLKYYQIFNDKFHLIFNSYYKSMGHHWVQGDRGQLSRPTVLEVKKYRKYVDDHLGRLLNRLIDKG